MRTIRTCVALLAVAALGTACAGATKAVLPQARAWHDHSSEIAVYEGTKTCSECHEKAAAEVAGSLHYQHQWAAPFLKDFPNDRKAGMMVSF